MFRIRKDDDQQDHGSPAAVEASPSTEPSSEPRSSPSPLTVHAFRPADSLGSIDMLEDVGFGEDADLGEGTYAAELPGTVVANDRHEERNGSRVPPRHFYDEDDDIDDFDELLALDDRRSPDTALRRPIVDATTIRLPAPDAFDFDADKVRKDASQHARTESPILKARSGETMARPAAADGATADSRDTRALLESDADRKPEAEKAEPARGSGKSSLALQPIPELQSHAGSSGSKAPPARTPADDQPSGDGSTDEAPRDDIPLLDDDEDLDSVSRADDPVEHGTSDKVAAAPSDLMLEPEDRITAEAAPSQAAMPGIEPAPEPKAAPADHPRHDEYGDDDDGDDDEMQLVELLPVEDDRAFSPPAAIHREVSQVEIDCPPVVTQGGDDGEGKDDSPPLSLSALSKQVSRLGSGSLATAPIGGIDPAPPSLMTRRANSAARKGNVAYPEIADGLLATAVVTIVPRLRRFAAALIGDEEEADHLVQTTIAAALSDPGELGPGTDLGLSLLILLFHKRQDMPHRWPKDTASLEDARAFETMLCRRLAGADQFEINEFAQAINGLAEEDRAPLLLLALEDLSYRDVAGVMGIPVGRIMEVVARSRLRLRRALGAYNPSAASDIPHNNDLHPREAEIHGYLDGELDDRHMADVDALIEHDDDIADRLLQYGIQGDLIRRLYAPLINRPVPNAMLSTLSAAIKPQPAWLGFRFGRKKALMAGAALLILGGLAALPYLASAIGVIVPEAVAISSKFAFG